MDTAGEGLGGRLPGVLADGCRGLVEVGRALEGGRVREDGRAEDLLPEAALHVRRHDQAAV